MIEQAISSFCQDFFAGGGKKLLVVPPDYSRFSSGAGSVLNKLVRALFTQKSDVIVDILPATGYHQTMTSAQKKKMFGDFVVKNCQFLTHNPFSADSFLRASFSVCELREIFPSFPDFIYQDFSFSVNSFLDPSRYDKVLSLGQVLPHEVVGMSNYTKNIAVGLGSKELIDFSHLASALVGMKNIIGRAKNSVRYFLDAAFEKLVKDYWGKKFIYFMLIVSRFEQGEATIHAIHGGFDEKVFALACKDALKVNVFPVSDRFPLVIVDLPSHYTSTWLANKSIYRLRNIISAGGLLLIIAPNLRRFGESALFDAQIRQTGYRCAEDIVVLLEKNRMIPAIAAHLIHGYVGNDFRVVYATEEKKGVKKQDLRKIGYDYMSLPQARELLANTEKSAETQSQAFLVKDPGQGFWLTEKDRCFLLENE